MFGIYRWVARLVVTVVVVGLIGVGVDYAARIETQDQIASAVKRSTGAASVSVSISSFPFLYHLLDQGRVEQITVDAHDIPAGPVTLSEVHLVADRVVLDRHDLLHGKERLKSVAAATVVVDLQLPPNLADAADAAGAGVVGSSDALEVEAAGRIVYRLSLSAIPLIPACDLQGGAASGSFTFSCTVAPVPAAVLASLSR